MLLIVYLVCPGLRFYTLWKPSSQIEIIFLNAKELGLARSLPLVFTPVRIPRETSNWPENTGSAHTAPKRETICRDSCLPTQCPVSQHIGASVCGLLTQDHLTDLSNAEFGRADYPVVAEIKVDGLICIMRPFSGQDFCVYMSRQFLPRSCDLATSTTSLAGVDTVLLLWIPEWGTVWSKYVSTTSD